MSRGGANSEDICDSYAPLTTLMPSCKFVYIRREETKLKFIIETSNRARTKWVICLKTIFCWIELWNTTMSVYKQMWLNGYASVHWYKCIYNLSQSSRIRKETCDSRHCSPLFAANSLPILQITGEYISMHNLILWLLMMWLSYIMINIGFIGNFYGLNSTNFINIYISLIICI